jgi:hypothetical protein
MSLERQKANSKRASNDTGYLKGILVAGALGTAAMTGAIEGTKEGSDKVSAHFFSPAAIVELKSETGATDAEISNLEPQIRRLLVAELRRLRNTK